MPQPIKITPTLIETCAWFDVHMKDLLGNPRSRAIVKARHVAMYLFYKHTDMSYPEVGKVFARDHTSVMNAVKRVEENFPGWELDVHELYQAAMAASFPEVEQ